MGVVFEPPPGNKRFCPSATWVCICVDNSLGPVLSHVNRAAPAPSPHRMQVARSFQFSVRVITSDATTSTYLHVLFLRYCSAIFSPKIKPEQAAVMSNVIACGASSLACRKLAADGQHMSGVMVATMMRSMSLAVKPAISTP